MSGVISLLQIPVSSFALNQCDGNFRIVNIVMLVLGLPLWGAPPLMMWWSSRPCATTAAPAGGRKHSDDDTLDRSIGSDGVDFHGNIVPA